MVGIIVEFKGLGKEKYDAIMRELKLEKKDSRLPKGLISHVAGPIPSGWCVIDLWETKQAFESYRNQHLEVAFTKVGGVPEPTVTHVPVHLSHFAPAMAAAH